MVWLPIDGTWNTSHAVWKGDVVGRIAILVHDLSRDLGGWRGKLCLGERRDAKRQ
jgi:hypothetical protein